MLTLSLSLKNLNLHLNVDRNQNQTKTKTFLSNVWIFMFFLFYFIDLVHFLLLEMLFEVRQTSMLMIKIELRQFVRLVHGYTDMTFNWNQFIKRIGKNIYKLRKVKLYRYIQLCNSLQPHLKKIKIPNFWLICLNWFTSLFTCLLFYGNGQTC